MRRVERSSPAPAAVEPTEAACRVERPRRCASLIVRSGLAAVLCLATVGEAFAWGRGGFGSVRYSGSYDQAYNAWSNNGAFGGRGYVGWGVPSLAGPNPVLLGAAEDRGYSGVGGGPAFDLGGGQRAGGLSNDARVSGVFRGAPGVGGGEGAAIRSPWRSSYADVRGPFGAPVMLVLPPGYAPTSWQGTTYYRNGFNFYVPYWRAGAVVYWPVSPPTGWFFPSLPTAGTINYTVNDNTYSCNGVYFMPAVQNGQQGYVVVAKPGLGATEQFPAATVSPVVVPSRAALVTSAPGRPVAGSPAGPNPFVLLRQMSDYLGRQNRFSVSISDTAEEMAQPGQKIQVSVVRTLYVQRPDKFAIDVQSGNDRRRVVSDGSGVTTIDLTRKLYGRIPAKGSIDSVVDALAKDYGMVAPANDLLYRDIYARVAGKIRTGQYLGPETLSGHPCHHLAFTQAGLDWQIWIEAGAEPVPRKIAIIHTAAPGCPRYTLQITRWDTAGVPASAFHIDLPAGAMQIAVLPVGRAAEAPVAP